VGDLLLIEITGNVWRQNKLPEKGSLCGKYDTFTATNGRVSHTQKPRYRAHERDIFRVRFVA